MIHCLTHTIICWNIADSTDQPGDEDFAFWFGDLNYRLDSMPAEDVRRLLMLHTRNEYGKEQKTRKSIDSELESPGSPVAIKVKKHFIPLWKQYIPSA